MTYDRKYQIFLRMTDVACFNQSVSVMPLQHFQSINNIESVLPNELVVSMLYVLFVLYWYEQVKRPLTE
jgi:hypothetical protein